MIDTTKFKKSSFELNGFFRAKVEETFDDGRVRVRIWGISDDNAKTDELPLAEPALSISWSGGKNLDGKNTSGFGSVGSGGNFVVPRVGNIVWIFFDNGSPSNPVYFANAVGGTDWEASKKNVDDRIAECNVDVINTETNCNIQGVGSNKDISVLATKSGASVIIDNSDGYEKIILLGPAEKKSFIVMDREGDLHIHSGNDENIDIKNDFKLHIHNDSKVKVNNDYIEELGSKTSTIFGDKNENVSGSSYSLILGSNGMIVVGTCNLFSIGGITVNTIGDINVRSEDKINVTAKNDITIVSEEGSVVISPPPC